MKAAFRLGTEVYLKEIDRPGLAADQIRLRVGACGICGTDLHWNSQPTKESPFGHEVAGTVLEVGTAVTNVKVGQTVALESSSACGQCDACRNMQQELCPNLRVFWNAGPALGFAEEMIAPAQCAVPFEGLKPEIACLSEPLGVAIDVLRVSEINMDSNVLVLGLGPIGLMALQLAKRRGARRVFATDLSQQTGRLALARRFGADEVFAADQTPVTKFAYGCGIDRILVTTPPSTLAPTFALPAKVVVRRSDQAWARRYWPGVCWVSLWKTRLKYSRRWKPHSAAIKLVVQSVSRNNCLARSTRASFRAAASVWPRCWTKPSCSRR